jgi:hypothetical protein
MRLPTRDAARAMWRLLTTGGWSSPAKAFPTRAERASAPSVSSYLVVVVAVVCLAAYTVVRVYLLVRGWQAGSPLGKGQRTVARHAVEHGWVRPRTWALPSDMQRLWVTEPTSGRPYLGVIGCVPLRMLAAELEVQPMIVAPPRVGKGTGFHS